MQYGFGAYLLDGEGRVLFREGVPVALPPKAAELLVALVQAAGTVAHPRAFGGSAVARYSR